MTGFRTKGRGKNRQVYPVSEGKEYRKDYSESFEANTDNPKPTFSTKHGTGQDIKQITTKATDRDTKEYDGKTARKNYSRYSRHTSDKMDKQFRKSDKKARKKDKKAQKKRDKQTEKIQKSEVDKQINYTKTEAKKEYADDQQDEAEDRELAAKIDGRENG